MASSAEPPDDRPRSEKDDVEERRLASLVDLLADYFRRVSMRAKARAKGEASSSTRVAR